MPRSEKLCMAQKDIAGQDRDNSDTFKKYVYGHGVD